MSDNYRVLGLMFGNAQHLGYNATQNHKKSIYAMCCSISIVCGMGIWTFAR
ncbi:hypothetical protein [uncultured Helicobacter sp.]|uniref:hypothetical protein n=1 Tax=uncultured Helicobacter sp. TaxID=175537 RepID=UPI00374F1152